MTAVKRGQVLAGEGAQPGEKGQRPLAQVAIHLAHGFHKHVLDHVGRIDAGSESPVEAPGDHLAEAFAVTSQEVRASAHVPLLGLPQ
jgi:hypothetical protein